MSGIELVSVAIPPADLAGVLAGSWLGASRAHRRGLDLVAFTWLGLASGLGGGVIRDLLLQAGPPLGLTRPIYLLVVLTGAVLASVAPRAGPGGDRLLAHLDTATLGLFAVAATLRTIDLGLPVGTALLLGVISGVGGGLVRDLLSGEPLAILEPGPFLPNAALCASLAALVCAGLGLRWLAPLVGAASGGLLRLLSLRRGWRLPRALRAEPEEGDFPA